MSEAPLKLRMARAKKTIMTFPPYYLWVCRMCDFAIKSDEDTTDVVMHMNDEYIFLCTKCYLDLRNAYVNHWKTLEYS